MNNFFLEGDKFIGKSTLLREVIMATGKSVSGFYVNRRINYQGHIVGFELRAAKEWGQQTPDMTPIADHCFIHTEKGRRTRNLQVFEAFGIALLKEAKNDTADIILLDEIGGIELLSSPFKVELLTLIQQPKKILGVFKSEENYHKQKKYTLEKLEIGQQRVMLRQEILKENGQILKLNEHNYSIVKNQLFKFLME